MSSAAATHADALMGLLDSIHDQLEHIAGSLSRQVSRAGVPFKVAAAITTTEILRTNRWRHLVTVYNDSTATMYLLLGSGATVDAYTTQLAPGDYYEAPAGYTGPVSAVWTAANGNARVTELA